MAKANLLSFTNNKEEVRRIEHNRDLDFLARGKEVNILREEAPFIFLY